MTNETQEAPKPKSRVARKEKRRGDEKNNRKKSVGREVFEWALCIVIAVAIAFLVHTFIGQLIIVKGSSMVPTLENGERVVVSKITYLVGEPKRGDVAVVNYPDSRDHFIKRVIALPGDTISISGGVLYLNGIPQEEPYIAEQMTYELAEMVVPEDTVFVLGDNRNRSKDSHVDSIGALTRDQIVGKAVCVAWPIKDWRTLKLPA